MTILWAFYLIFATLASGLRITWFLQTINSNFVTCTNLFCHSIKGYCLDRSILKVQLIGFPNLLAIVASKSAGRISGLYVSISATFRFTCKKNLLYWPGRFARRLALLIEKWALVQDRRLASFSTSPLCFTISVTQTIICCRSASDTRSRLEFPLPSSIKSKASRVLRLNSYTMRS